LFQFTPPVTDDDFKGTPLLVIQPRNSKFQGPRPPVKRKSSAMQGESTELTNIAFSSVVVYGTSITYFYNIAISHAQVLYCFYSKTGISLYSYVLGEGVGLPLKKSAILRAFYNYF